MQLFLYWLLSRRQMYAGNVLVLYTLYLGMRRDTDGLCLNIIKCSQPSLCSPIFVIQRSELKQSTV